MTRAVPLVFGAWAACADAGDGAPACEFVGDPGAAVEMQAGFRAADGAFVALAEGAAIDLVVPVQGGECMFPAPRARNLCGNDVRIEATLSNEAGEALGPFAVNSRMIERDGWLVPDMEVNSSAVPNVCACPNQWSGPIDGASLTLDLAVLDRAGGRESGVAVGVVPTCDALPDDGARALCECECGPGPVQLGDC